MFLRNNVVLFLCCGLALYQLACKREESTRPQHATTSPTVARNVRPTMPVTRPVAVVLYDGLAPATQPISGITGDRGVPGSEEEWVDFLHRRVEVGMSLAELDQVLEGMYEDKAPVALGGLADRIGYIYRISGTMDVGFTIQGGRVENAHLIRRDGPWKKDHHGYLDGYRWFRG